MPDRLTIYELELMDVLWELGEGTVQDVVDALNRDLAYTSVMTTLNILHAKKGVLSREKEGRAFVYKPNLTREKMSKKVLEELQPVLFKKKLLSLMLSLLSREKLDNEDIDSLKDALAKVENNRAARKQKK